jgi:hypothetical protein
MERQMTRGKRDRDARISSDGRPEVLYMATEIVHLWDLNIKAETFSVELVVHTKWAVDAASADKVMEESGGDLNEHWEPEWMPRLKVRNTTAELTSREHEFEAHRSVSGTVWISGVTWLSVTISEEYDLQPFPFDMQHLEVEVEVPNAVHLAPMQDKPSRSWGSKLVEPVLVHKEGVEHLPDFKLNQQVPCSYKYIRGDASEASVLVTVMVYERAYAYHMWNSYGVLCCLGTVNLATWALPVSELGTRLSLDITLLLVTVAFKQVLNSELPPVSYLTILDHYSLVIIGFVFLATWLHGFVGLMELEGVEDRTVRLIDLLTIVFYAGAFVLWNVWHAAFVRTQLFFNDVMTDRAEISHHGFQPAQMGQVDASGSYAKVDVHVNSVFGQYADRPSRAQPHEVIPTIRLLIRAVWEGRFGHAAARSEYRRASLLGEGGFARLEEVVPEGKALADADANAPAPAVSA